MREKDEKLVAFIKCIKMTEEGFDRTFTFEFAENCYIENQFLTKTIFQTDKETATHSEGSEIKWKGEDFTKKVTSKKQKNKKTG